MKKQRTGRDLVEELKREITEAGIEMRGLAGRASDMLFDLYEGGYIPKEVVRQALAEMRGELEQHLANVQKHRAEFAAAVAKAKRAKAGK